MTEAAPAAWTTPQAVTSRDTTVSEEGAAPPGLGDGAIAGVEVCGDGDPGEHWPLDGRLTG